jgi:hypothetical protein
MQVARARPAGLSQRECEVLGLPGIRRMTHAHQICQ